MNSPTTSIALLRRIGVIAAALACVVLIGCGSSDGTNAVAKVSGAGSASGGQDDSVEGKALITIGERGGRSDTVEIQVGRCSISDSKVVVRGSNGADSVDMSDTSGKDPTFTAEVGGKAVAVDTFDAASVKRTDSRFVATGGLVDGRELDLEVTCS